MIFVVPRQEALTEGVAVFRAAEAIRESGAIFRGAELAFRIRIVVGNIEPAVGFGQFGAFARGDHPADDVAAEDIPDDVQIIVSSFDGAA